MSAAKGAAGRKRQQELDRGSKRAQSLREEAAAEKRIRRGERFPRVSVAHRKAGKSRTWLAAQEWLKGTANNPLAQLGGSQLGRLAERRFVRRTLPLSWALLVPKTMPDGSTRIVATMYRTEAAAIAAAPDDATVQYRGYPRNRWRTAKRVAA